MKNATISKLDYNLATIEVGEEQSKYLEEFDKKYIKNKERKKVNFSCIYYNFLVNPIKRRSYNSFKAKQLRENGYYLISDVIKIVGQGTVCGVSWAIANYLNKGQVRLRPIHCKGLEVMGWQKKDGIYCIEKEKFNKYMTNFQEFS